MVRSMHDVAGMAHDQRIRCLRNLGILAGVIQRRQEMAHGIQARPLLVVGLDDRPGRIGGVGVKEHRLFRFGVVIPLVEAGLVDRAQLPLLERVGFPAGETGALFVLSNREPVFVEPDARAHQHPLQVRGLAHEFKVFVGLAKPHDPLDARAVIPAAVVKGHLARRRQMLKVALEEPLAAFLVRGFVQRHDAREAWVEMLGKPLDRAALASSIAPLEQDDEFLTRLLRPELHLQKLGLKPRLFSLVFLARQLARVRIFSGLEGLADLVRRDFRKGLGRGLVAGLQSPVRLCGGRGGGGLGLCGGSGGGCCHHGLLVICPERPLPRARKICLDRCQETVTKAGKIAR